MCITDTGGQKVTLRKILHNFIYKDNWCVQLFFVQSLSELTGHDAGLNYYNAFIFLKRHIW